MSDWKTNIYYNPEKSGLQTVGEIDWFDEPYEFDLTVVWRRTEDGQLFYSNDSGCSCPVPFDEYSVDDLTACTLAELQAYLAHRNDGLQETWGRTRDAEIVDLITRARAS